MNFSSDGSSSSNKNELGPVSKRRRLQAGTTASTTRSWSTKIPPLHTLSLRSIDLNRQLQLFRQRQAQFQKKLELEKRTRPDTHLIPSSQSRQAERPIETAVLGEDNRLQELNKRTVGGEDNRLQELNKRTVGGEDNRLQELNKRMVGGEDNRLQELNKMTVGGEDNRLQELNKRMVGGEDIRLQELNKRTVGGEDHWLQEQNCKNQRLLDSWKGTGHRSTWNLGYSHTTHRNKNEINESYFPAMPNIGKFVYFGENHPLLYCSNSLSNGSFTTRYLVHRSEVVRRGIVGEPNAELPTAEGQIRRQNTVVPPTQPSPQSYCSVIQFHNSINTYQEPCGRKAEVVLPPLFPNSLSKCPKPLQSPDPVTGEAGALHISIIPCRASKKACLPPLSPERHHQTLQGSTPPASHIRTPQAPPPDDVPPPEVGGYSGCPSETVEPVVGQDTQYKTSSSVPRCNYRQSVVLEPSSNDPHHRYREQEVLEPRTGSVRHFPVTLQSRSLTDLNKRVASTSSQTDWSLQPAEPFLFIATKQVELPGNDKLDSETETDEGDHSLDVSLDNSTLPGLMQTEQEFVLANHSYMLNENTEALGDIDCIAKQHDNFLDNNCNDFFMGEDENSVNESFQKLDMNLLAGGSQINFNAENIDQPFSSALEFSQLDKMMNSGGGGSGDGRTEEDDNHIDNIVNDIVDDLMNNNADLKREVDQNKESAVNEQDFNLDFDVFHSKPIREATVFEPPSAFPPLRGKKVLAPQIIDNISMFMESDGTEQGNRYEETSTPRRDEFIRVETNGSSSDLYVCREFEPGMDNVPKEMFSVLDRVGVCGPEGRDQGFSPKVWSAPNHRTMFSEYMEKEDEARSQDADFQSQFVVKREPFGLEAARLCEYQDESKVGLVEGALERTLLGMAQ